MTLLTREQFKSEVFKRDEFKCVICKKEAIDAHHIIDRSLWDNQGYYLNNGVSLCATHHLDAEKTLISCEELRTAANIQNICYPEHFYIDEKYDHWGNIVLSSGMRTKGELFFYENVQKILKEANLLNIFLKYIKYPRTYHLPDSPNLGSDDKKHPNIDFFKDKHVTASIKMDGECTTMYDDYIHARSLSSTHHESRSWIKAFHNQIKQDIFPNYRICGENLYAKHSIHYLNLLNYFYVFSIWDNQNCLPVEETLEHCELLNLVHVPIFYQGIWDREKIHQAFLSYDTPDLKEGYVIRLAEGFNYNAFRKCTAKWVRKDHVETDEHWMSKKVIPNKQRLL